METDQNIRDRRQREFACSKILAAPTDISAVVPWWLTKIENQKQEIDYLLSIIEDGNRILGEKINRIDKLESQLLQSDMH